MVGLGFISISRGPQILDKKFCISSWYMCNDWPLYMFVLLWAVMLRVGRSVVMGHSGGCHCPGDHALLHARASVWRG